MRPHEESSLSLAQPAGIAELARLFSSASDLAETTAGDLRRTAGGLITGDWSGHAATAFAGTAAEIERDLRSATTALRHAATVLDRLSWDIGEARTAAVSAMSDAADVDQETVALNAAWEAERAAGSTEPSLGLRLRADDLDARAAALHRRMGEANERGHRAFNSAAGAFDGVTETAPQVKALLARSRAAQDQTPRPLQVLKGIGELALGVVASGADALLGAVDAAQLGLDPGTDALTVADGAAVARLVPGALRDLADASAATETAADTGASAAWDANKLNHIFGNSDHGLDGVTQTLGGQSEVIDVAQSSLQGPDIPSSGLFEVTRTIGGQSVTIRGAVVDGVPRIGTMWANP